jgi:hypothetical protein
MQPSARRLTPWLRWTRALFAVLGRYPLSRRGRLGLGLGRLVAPLKLISVIGPIQKQSIFRKVVSFLTNNQDYGHCTK